MPWENRNNGGGRGPWGQGPLGGGSGRGGPQPPDLEDLLRRGQERLRQSLPSGSFGAGGMAIAVGVLIVLWLASGIYIVGPRERGIELRFGKFSEETQPGPNYHLPWPFESAEVVDVEQVYTIAIGYAQGETSGGGVTRARDVSGESLMLTGDENIVDIDFSVVWKVRDAKDFTFNVLNPPDTIKAVAESAMREVIGRSRLIDVLGNEADVAPLPGREPPAEGQTPVDPAASRTQIVNDVQELMQQTLDAYGAGVLITEVQLQRVDPPSQVIEAFRDVQAARADRERLRNEAEAYKASIIPDAKGEAARIVQQAEAYKQQSVAEARGEAQRFLAIYEQYKLAPEVTRQRLFLETMERVYTGMNKVILDEKQTGSGVVPYLPLGELRPPPAAPSQPAPGGN